MIQQVGCGAGAAAENRGHMAVEVAFVSLREMPRGEDHDWRPLGDRVGSKSFDDFESADIRHHQIEQDKIWTPWLGENDRLASSPSLDRGETGRLKDVSKPFPVSCFVVHDEDRGSVGMSEVEPVETLDQLLAFNWLDEVIHRAKCHPKFRIVNDTYDDNWDVAGRLIVLQSRHDLPPVKLRQKNVQRYGRGPQLARHRNGLCPGSSRPGAESGGLQLSREQLSRGRVILDHEHQGT